MTSNIIRLKEALGASEYAAIDSFCAKHKGQECLAELGRFLKDKFSLEVTLDPDIVAGFKTDSSNLRGEAKGLCRLSTERECAIVLRACHKAGIPVTVSAGKSNLTGSATPNGGVIVSTTKMLKPEVRVSADGQSVEAPVGMILEDMRRAVLEQTQGKVMYPVDPTSRGDATVGGTIACNASGFVPGEAGATRQWVKSIDFLFPNGLKARAERGEFVSADGKFVLEHKGGKTELPVPTYRRPTIKNAGGPYSRPDGKMDFVDFVIGSEGIFGVVTACTLKLTPRPAQYLDLFFSLAEEKNALAFYFYLRNKLEGNLGRLTAFEYFGVNSRRHMDHEERLFRGDDKVAIYLQAPLTDQSVEDAAGEWLEALVAADCGINEEAILLLDNDRDRQILLEARHSLPANALEVVQHRGTYTIMTDTAVPPERFAEFLEFNHKLLAAERLDYVAFGHFGDCHLHFTILPETAQLERATEVYDMIVAKSAELGGVYSGEHGTGKRKRKDFLRCYGEAAVREVKRCKAAVDPELLLNRGNVVEA